MIKKFVIILIIFCSPSVAFGEIFCVNEGDTWNSSNCGVDCSGEVSANTCMDVSDFNSSGNWDTDVSDDNLIGPGDTIYFSGTITDEIEPQGSGLAGNYITLDGYEAGNCDPLNTYCTGQATINPQFDSNNGVRILDKSYIAVVDLEITDFENAWGIAIQGDSHFISVKRNYVHHGSLRGINMSHYPTGGPYSSNITIGGAPGDGNVVRNIGNDDYGDISGGNDVGVNFNSDTVVSYNRLYADDPDWGVDGIMTHHASKLLIEYNQIYGHNYNKEGPWGENGIDLKYISHDVIIRYNDIHDHIYENNIHVQLDTYNTYIYGNRIYNGGNSTNKSGGILIYLRSSAGAWSPTDNTNFVGEMRNIKIWSNLIYNNYGSGISVLKSSTCVGCTGIYDTGIYNNVIADSALGAQYSTDVFGLLFNSNGNGHVVKNNIFYNNRPDSAPAGNDRAQLYSQDSISSVTLDSNDYYSADGSIQVFWDTALRSLSILKSSYSQELNGAEGNPGFTAPGSKIYTLDGTNINNGENLTQCHNIVIQGNNYSICYRDALDPSTDWLALPSPSTIKAANQNSYGSAWERGAYVYGVAGTATGAQMIFINN